MRRLLIALVLLVAAPAAAQQTLTFGEEPTLFVTVEPEELFSRGAWVQGEIVVTIRVTSLHPFEALDVAVPRIEGAVVETLLKPRLRRVKSYAGDGYVLEQALAIYPQASGPLVIPEVRATGTVEPERDRPLTFTETSPEIVLDIAGIPPSFAGEWWMVSPAVTMTETWSIPVEDLREGDVVRREITLIARGVPHDRMKLPDHGRTRGIAFTDAGGTGRTERTADGVVGTLTRAWDLKIGTGSTLYIAPMAVHYWHSGEGAGRRAGVRGYRIEPLPADEEAIAAALMQEAEAAHGGARMLALVLASLVALPFVALLAAWAWALVPTRADRRLAATAAGASPARIHRAAVAWAAAGGVSMTDLRHAGTPALAALFAHLFAAPRQPAGGRGDGQSRTRPDAAVDGRQVARELLRIGRRNRIHHAVQWPVRFARWLIGAPAGLSADG